MKFEFKGKTYDENGIMELMDSLETEDSVEDFLSESFPEFEIGSLSYSAGRVLRQIDEIAFREIVLEEIDNAVSEAVSEAESSEIGDRIQIQYLGEVTVVETDSEDE